MAKWKQIWAIGLVALLHLIGRAGSVGLAKAFPVDSVKLHTNAEAMALHSAGKYQESYQLLLSLDSLYKHQPLDSTRAHGYFILGQNAYQLRMGQEAVMWHSKALAWRQAHLPPSHSQLIESHLWLGNVYRFTLLQPYAALPHFQQAMTLAEAQPIQKPRRLRALAYSMATTYRLIKDVERGLYYGNKALALAQADSTLTPSQLASHHNMVGNLHLTNTEYRKAIPHFTQAIALIGQQYPDGHSRQLRYYNNLASCYIDLDMADSAALWANKSFTLNQAHYQDSALLGTTLYVLGKVHAIRAKWSKADSTFLQAIAVRQAVWGSHHGRVTEIYRHWASYYIHYELQPAKALALIDSALVRLWPGLPPAQMAYRSLPGSTDYEALFVALNNRGLALRKLAMAQNNTILLQQAVAFHQQAIRIYRDYRKTQLETGGLLGQAKWHQWLLDGALETLAIAYKQSAQPAKDTLASLAWEWIETGKGVILLKTFQQGQAKHQGGLPDTLWTEYQRLTTRLAHFRTEQLQRPSPTIADSLYALERAIAKWQQRVRRKYRAFHDIRSQQNPIPMKRAALSARYGKIGINYWEGSQQWFALALVKEASLLYTIPKTDSVTKALQHFQTFVRQTAPALISAEQARTAARSGHMLYTLLVAPALALAPQPSELKLLPHGQLEHLPFAALLSAPPPEQPNAYHRYPFLIKRYSLFYALSGTMWYHQNQQSRYRANNQLLAMAWGTGKTRQQRRGLPILPPLPATTKEINAALSQWKGQGYSGAQATEARFRANAPDANILHLAVHGVLNAEAMGEPALIFPATDSVHDGVLYLHELYELPLKASLTILSACESSNGQFAPGEGVMSLARGFAYAGSGTLLASQWQLHDGTAQQLLSHWHQQLRQGDRIPLDVALKESTLDYLAQANALQAHPSRWAALTLIGPNSSIYQENLAEMLRRLPIWAVGLAALLLITWFIKKRWPQP